MKQAVTVPITREDLIRALRIAGLKLPDDVLIAVKDGQVVGVDGPLELTFDVEVDVGAIRE